ncbi:hypothetical protein [Vallitalea sp.]|jgi:hypothetical protein|uniref:hypothetical protein n=1 Tax=Vallitalea sp. TaxID=1882829 RepID=UPI0025DFB196|nr:hypothetical protein [Vallitalea sp.]MCT4686053.1 hypothetical protein [Vallitalea sp.]
MKKIIICILTILLSVLICSCTSKNNQDNLLEDNDKKLSDSNNSYNQDSDNNQNTMSRAVKNIPNQQFSSDHSLSDSDTIIAWEPFLLGSYNKEENYWKSCSPIKEVLSITPITFGDILTKSSFYVFYEKQLIGESRKISFPYSAHYSLEDMENSKKLIELAKTIPKREGDYVFNLPVSLDKNLYNLPYPDNGLLISFEIDYKNKELPNFKSNKLVLSNKLNPYPRNYFLTDNVPKKTTETVDSLFAKYKVTDIIPNYKYCYSGDFDDDNELEYLTVINNKLGENNEIVVSSKTQIDETAFYNIIIYQDGTTIQILKDSWNIAPKIKPTIKGNDKYYSNYYWNESNYSILSNLLIADVNGDNKYEFLFESREALVVNFETYSIFNNDYHLVLKSSYPY